jgi:DNA-binding CsgD family transcriptional regulator
VSELRQKDYRRILGFLETLYSLDGEAGFSSCVVREIPKLVDCHHVSWNEMAFAVPRSTVVEYPRLVGIEARTAIFSEHILEHPGLIHYLSTGDTTPVSVSDFLSPGRFERTSLYQRLYRSMGYEDQIGMCLSPPKGEVAAMSLARDRRGFDRRDRETLTLLQPHLARAHGNAKALSRARRRLGDCEPESINASILEVGAGGKIEPGSTRAPRMLSDFFAAEGALPRALPDSLKRWLRHRGHIPLVVLRGGRQLVARFFPARPRNGMLGLLLLEELATPEAALELRARGLTSREIQVLVELEKGRTNEGIAAVLFISPRTVKKHLENIYAKLGVGSRSAALAWMHRELRAK